jgi:hypothetical protein
MVEVAPMVVILLEAVEMVVTGVTVALVMGETEEEVVMEELVEEMVVTVVIVNEKAVLF